ncbi:uncharacterized protein F5Z01DRAFT_124065 [Emericellopsis atlantica]|uniref:Zn(2)-C6 fungal-type domain-containing protein n=1 Tax=Emericellopsis atlantica TaxID=2614577 RepID=A0A9P7ZKC2_9HYPO|nr:uncharacterized protein F5Z01DRAFT_124065 [Emericellopsis atlantica]KAG9253704.1 hypothetical protein F5Z01DRAFT_124065 [Emericellopsis atlantica]
MFGTWKYDPETDEVQNLRRAFDPVTARSSQHQACNRCHEKKLKCSGEKEGCERCVAHQLACDYSRSNSRGSRRGKKSHHRSAETTSPANSQTPSGSGSTSTKRGSGSRSRHLSPQQQTGYRGGQGAVYGTPSSSRGEEPSMLDQLDDSFWTGEPFDMNNFDDDVVAPTTSGASHHGYPNSAMDVSMSAHHQQYHAQYHQQTPFSDPEAQPTLAYHSSEFDEENYYSQEQQSYYPQGYHGHQYWGGGGGAV